MSNNDSLISSGDVEYVAKLAHLHLDETEKKDMETKLGSILGYMHTGTSLNITSWNIGFGAYTDDYSFFMDGGEYSRGFSEDIVGETLDTEKALAQAPERDGNYYKVPKIL